MSLRETATEIVRRLRSGGFEAYWVGGCVRDVFLGHDPVDYDVASSARPEQIETLFSRTIPVGKQFGVMLVIENDHQFQVATFRAESDYTDGRRPGHVEFSSAQADALRRDFTVNGLFFDPVSQQLYDWVGGEADLRARILRTIGSPAERFAEDHLRLLRAVRFAAQLGFKIEGETFDALRANASKIQTVSAERIREELIKLFRPPHAGQGLDLLRQSGLLQYVLPELAATVTCEQSPNFHPEGTVFNHLRLMLEHLPPDAHESLPWAALMHDIAKPHTASRDPDGTIHFYGHEKVGAEMAEVILRRLRFPRKQIDEVVQSVLCHMQFKDVKGMRKATLRRLLLRETFPLELQLHRLDCLGSHGRLDHYNYLLEQVEELRRQPDLKPPLLTGQDLIALGMSPGPAMGALLAEIREKQLQDELSTPEEAREWAKQRLDERTKL
ncbi:MAG: CCA tRNA nucleotidyltransferase [Verrucomicrobiales bacterium]|nr:CCA tRNA nucleotidyltransferase [Verrucomicrobiales bacterium]